MTALFESGQVWFSEADKNSRHTKALIEQLLAFDAMQQHRWTCRLTRRGNFYHKKRRYRLKGLSIRQTYRQQQASIIHVLTSIGL